MAVAYTHYQDLQSNLNADTMFWDAVPDLLENKDVLCGKCRHKAESYSPAHH